MSERCHRFSGLADEIQANPASFPELRIILIALILPLFIIFFGQQGACSNSETKLVQTGIWGGEHISVSVDDNGARLEYDCAHGTIDQPMKVDSKGRFNVTGTHTRESGGPARIGEKPQSRPALYSGQVTREKMVITITLRDTKETLGTFTVTYGKRPNLFKCK